MEEKMRKGKNHVSRRAIEALESRLFLAVNAWQGGSGDWDDTTHWSLAHRPAADEDVSITANGDYTVTLNTAAAVKSLTLGASGSSATGTQTLSANAEIAVTAASA